MKATNPYVQNFGYPYFSFYSKGGEKINGKSCTMYINLYDVGGEWCVTNAIFPTIFSLCSQQVFTVELPSEASYVSTAEISAKLLDFFQL